jgi:acetyltransferase-like isoleucine patch superfamily enzyme
MAADPDLHRRALARVRRAAWGITESGGLRQWLFYLPGPGPRLMSSLRKWWVTFRNPRANIEFQGRVYLGPGFSLDMPYGGTFIVGPDVEFRRGFRAEFGAEDTRISIGEGSRFTYDALIQCTTSIDIGKHCMLGQATLLVDGNHRFRDTTRLVLEQGHEWRPLRIEDHAVIFTKATVMADVGERAIVSANSLVTQPVPAYTLVGGVPARALEYFGPTGEGPGPSRASS